MPIKDPYWLIRSRAHLLDIPIFGEKSFLQQNIEILLFNSSTIDYDKITQFTSEVKHKASIDLFEKKYGKLEIELTNGNIY